MGINGYIDEADVPRTHVNGIPMDAVATLKRPKPPDTPNAVDVRTDPDFCHT